MYSSRESLLFRIRWIAVFAVVLLASSAIPVLAASPPVAPPADQPQALEADSGNPPSALEVSEGLDGVEESEAREDELRETPEAKAERAASESAFADLEPDQSAALLEAQFSELLQSLSLDPARVLTEARLDTVLSPTDARITVDGETMLMDGSLPVRAEDEDGELRKVDLELEADPEGFVPVNPLTSLTLPGEASEATAIGDGGLAITPVTTEGDSTARRFNDTDLFYPETQTDTDLLATPISTGLELFSQLRSPDSPEELRFQLSLPAGAELREDGAGGAEVVRDEALLALVRMPTAADAQGADVPVAMRVESDSLVLEVEHRGGEFAYPLLVDP